jgi:transposase
MLLAEEIAVLRKQNKELTKANKRLQEENEFLVVL